MQQGAHDHAVAAPEVREARTLAGTVLRVQRQARGGVPAGRACGNGGSAVRGGVDPWEFGVCVTPRCDGMMGVG